KLKVDYSSLRAQWTPETILASLQDPTIPGIYRLRDTLAPTAEYNLTKDLKVRGGFAFTELQFQNPVPHFQDAHTAIGFISYGHKLSESQDVGATYTIGTAARSIGSDLVYTRQLWTADYSLAGRKVGLGPFGSMLPVNQFQLAFRG